MVIKRRKALLSIILTILHLKVLMCRSEFFDFPGNSNSSSNTSYAPDELGISEEGKKNNQKIHHSQVSGGNTDFGFGKIMTGVPDGEDLDEIQDEDDYEDWDQTTSAGATDAAYISFSQNVHEGCLCTNTTTTTVVCECYGASVKSVPRNLTRGVTKM